MYTLFPSFRVWWVAEIAYVFVSWKALASDWKGVSSFAFQEGWKEDDDAMLWFWWIFRTEREKGEMQVYLSSSASLFMQSMMREDRCFRDFSFLLSNVDKEMIILIEMEKIVRGDPVFLPSLSSTVLFNGWLENRLERERDSIVSILFIFFPSPFSSSIDAMFSSFSYCFLSSRITIHRFPLSSLFT